MSENFAADLEVSSSTTSPVESTEDQSRREWSDAAARGLIAVVASVLAWYTWAHWGDIQIDCGRELYVPAEILRGKLLYRDIFYPYGPLAPYVGALLVGIFGPHLVVFYLFGIAIAIVCAMLLFELGEMLEGRAVGLTAALALLLVGFAPKIFNYPFPYSYAATMGLMLSLACVYFALRHALGRSGYNMLIAGMAASLAMLSKQEFGATCYLTLAFVIVMEAIVQRSMRTLVRDTAACAPGVVLWVAILGWFFVTLTPAFMIDANWIGTPGTYSMQTYGARLYSGVGQRFVPSEVARFIAADGLTLLLWFLVARLSSRWPYAALVVAIAFLCLFHFAPFRVAALLVSMAMVFPKGMFFIGCAFLGYTFYELYRRGGDRRFLAEAALGVFVLLPATRVMVGAAPFGYSVFYVPPLFLVFIITITRCIKAAVPTLGDGGRRKLVNSLLAAEIVMVAIIGLPHENERTARLETSWGEMYLTPDDASVAHQIIDFMSEQGRLGRQVDVVPEAALLYAFAGTEAPSRWYTLLPGLLSPAQEEVYIADLNRANPDYILLTSRKTREYDADYFGIDYDKKVYHWIESNYRIAGEFGSFRRDDSNTITQGPLAALLYEKVRPGGKEPTRESSRDAK